MSCLLMGLSHPVLSHDRQTRLRLFPSFALTLHSARPGPHPQSLFLPVNLSGRDQTLPVESSQPGWERGQSLG